MKRVYTHYFILFCVLIGYQSIAQTNAQRAEIVSKTKTTKLQQFKKYLNDQQSIQEIKKQQFLNTSNTQSRFKTTDGKLYELQKIDNGTPIYYTTYNEDAARSTRTNYLHTNGGLGLNVNGQNMTAHVWDGGIARATHQEYDGPGGNNRFSVGDTGSSLNFHAAHVTGTIIAFGGVAGAKGMAPRAQAIGYDWNSDLTEATTAAANGMLVSNHSYGYAVRDPNTGQAWLPAYIFGGYVDDSRNWDNLMYNAPYYMMVVAGGNDGTDDTANSTPLGNNAQYDKLTGTSTCKNNIVVANAQDAVINANGTLSSVVINNSSSEGPTDDLRIKPDITGNGTDVLSTYEGADNEYAIITGTSMASPNVAGSLLLLQEHYNNVNGNFMRAATLKGLALHTTDEAGPIGPDPVYGWGLMNTKRAAETISNAGNTAVISELTLAQGQTYQINVNATPNTLLQASISWTDPAGATTTVVNNSSPRLVNDLDIRITQNGNTYNPWRLTGVTTNGKGDNTVDPFERAEVGNTSGTYTITVSHKGTLTGGSQNYSLIITGINSVAPCTTTTPSNLAASNIDDESALLSWNNVPSATYEVRFRESGTTSWTTATANGTTYNVNGLSPLTSYEAQVRSVCSNSNGAWSASTTFTTTDVTYCNANGNSQADEYISNVQFANVTNPTGAENGGYGDYTNLTANVIQGQSYNLQITPTWANNIYNEGYAVFIDYNKDGDFTDSGEQAWTQTPTNSSPVSGTITIPNNSISGTTRMRVILRYNAVPSSCGTFDYGEVEDYTINIVSPSCDNISNLNVTDIGVNEISLSWTDTSTPTTTAWEAMILPAGSATPSSVSSTNTTNNNYTFTGLTPNTVYDIYVRSQCANTFIKAENITTLDNYCGTNISDLGGESGNYANIQTQIYTICPENPGDKVVLNFSEFNLENNGTACYDGLTLYDGKNLNATIIAPPAGGNAWCWDRNDVTPSGSGDLLNSSIAASNSTGCITLVFNSNATETRDGFTASVNCESTVYLWNGSSWTNNPESNITSGDNLYINDGNTAVMNSGITVKSLFMDDNASIDLNSGNLNVTSHLSNHNRITGSGAVILSGTTNQKIIGKGDYENLQINNTAGANIMNDINLTGSLKLNNGTLYTNNHLTFKSDLNHTAVIETVESTASINGNVTVEKYIPAGNRAFRFIGPTLSGVSIFNSWQEAGNNALGWGTHVTGLLGTVGNHDPVSGLDYTASGNPSMFTWNTTTQSWNAVTNTKNTMLNPGDFYRILVRGDRTTDLTTNTPAVTETNLRANGTLHTGDMNMSISVNNGEYFTMANPYQSKLDMSQISTNNVANDMYYWDPTLGAKGNYATIDMTTGNTTAGNSSNVLEPGQAVFMLASASNPTINMSENDKVNGTSNAGIIRSTNLSEFIKLKLYQSQRLMNNQSESDGLYIHFDPSFSNMVDINDAVKFNGLNTNISISKASSNLSVERRDLPQHNESINLHIANYQSNQFTYAIEVSALNGTNTYLKDHVRNSLTLLQPGVVNYYDFDIDANNPNTIANDRFELVFQNVTLSNPSIDNDEPIQVYPNPITDNRLHIDLGNINIDQADLHIYNSLGQLLIHKDITQQSISINGLESWANGVYILEVKTQNATYTQRFIKK